jgi:hypothetical protein
MWRGRYSARPTPFYSARIYDPVFAKTSPRRSFSVIENERFGLVFAKTGSINSGTGGFWTDISRRQERFILHLGYLLHA